MNITDMLQSRMDYLVYLGFFKDLWSISSQTKSYPFTSVDKQSPLLLLPAGLPAEQTARIYITQKSIWGFLSSMGHTFHQLGEI